jgi:hypothetical protein
LEFNLGSDASVVAHTRHRSQRGPAHNKAVIDRQVVLTHGILNKPAFALPGTARDIIEELGLSARSRTSWGNIITRHIVDDIK